MLRRNPLPLAIALLFVFVAAVSAHLLLPATPLRLLLVFASAAAAYFALNVGANDVANNVGPAVGSKAIGIGAALAITAVFDAGGALLAGGQVVDTVAFDLIRIDPAGNQQTLVLMMIAALLAAAAWVNLSTALRTPISTTHAIVGGIVGAAIAAAGIDAVQWPNIGIIAVSWTISPVLGGALAAVLHALTNMLITQRAERLAAARRWIPLLCGLLCGMFATYLASLLREHRFDWSGIGVGVAAGLLAWGLARPWIRRRARSLNNRKKKVAQLFRAPLILAAALLSFAHGANDVANILGPLVAIHSIVGLGGTTVPATLPFWPTLTAAGGIALGLALFGPRVIHTVGQQITKLNETRAFCVALAAAIIVLLASALGLPVSSTHVAVGAVFGVGFLREFLAVRDMTGAAVPTATQFLDASLLNDTPQKAIERERRTNRRALVRRFLLVRIIAAWLATLPAAAALGAATYLALRAVSG